MGVTNKELLQFYAGTGKREDYPITRKYMENHTLSGDYIKLAKKFLKHKPEEKKGENIETTDKDEQFYQHLNDHRGSMMLLKALRDEDPTFDYLLERTGLNDPLLQKWHLYVSFYALEEYWAKDDAEKARIQDDDVQNRFGILRGQTTCRALLLWMCEASGSEQTDKLLKDIEDIEAKFEAVNVQLRKWLQTTKEEIINRVQNGNGQKHEETH